MGTEERPDLGSLTACEVAEQCANCESTPQKILIALAFLVTGLVVGPVAIAATGSVLVGFAIGTVSAAVPGAALAANFHDTEIQRQIQDLREIITKEYA